jgi:glutathione reductase (NADPH)
MEMIDMKDDFDLIVIGTGASGQNVAYRCKEAGMKTAIVDCSPFGGTCALRGCNPKKVLHGASDIIDSQDNMDDMVKGSLKLDWGKLMEFKKTFIDNVPEKQEKGFNENGIRTFKGTASFTGKNTLLINGSEYSAGFIAIASGSIPRKLDFPGAGLLTTSDIFMETEKLPARIIFVGGGYISFELAHIAVRAGADVKIIHRSKRPLKKFDRDMVDMLLEATGKAGIEFIPGIEPEKIEEKNGSLYIECGDKAFTCDMAVHGAGRIPNTGLLELEKGDVEEDRGVLVNEFLQSISNPKVYAAGDVASIGQPLTPVVSMQGKAAAHNIINGNSRTVDYSMTPSVVFTIPPLASVGLTEEEAQKKGLKYRVNTADSTGWYNSRRLGLKKTGYKMIIEENTDRILGAHIMGPMAEETINFVMLAMKTGIKAPEIKDMIFSYPSTTYDMKYMI